MYQVWVIPCYAQMQGCEHSLVTMLSGKQEAKSYAKSKGWVQVRRHVNVLFECPNCAGARGHN